MLAFFLSQNKINLSALHFSLLPSFNPQPATLVSGLFLWPSSSSETTWEPLLKRTDRSTVKRNKRKDRFSLLKPQKLERKKAKVCHRAGGDRILGINNAACSGLGRLGAKRPWERAEQLAFYGTTSHVYCYLFTAFRGFLCLTCPPSECVLFSQLLAIEGGHKQTQIKEQAALAFIVCCGYDRN